MLMITPEGMKLVRAALAGWNGRTKPAPITLAGPQPRKPKAKRVTEAYRRALIEQTIAIMRKGEPSVFAFEGFMRHGIRSGLCLRGWSWREADDVAADVVGTALARLGAKRPTWQQAQPEWTQEGVLLIDRERCVNCGWQLPDGHRKYCSSRCANSMKGKAYRRFVAEQMEAVYADAP
ncbi:MAG: hypothetical protein B7Z40_20110 [Bosea sp. 12-68-7]|nr:MAG: hypothetical protein B7Z40_20110 [Bosea sp. 12-68-7]OYX01258.1 MAG: hypothetical protein B7Z14_06720 [Bosea sp. 32-68-6]